jgi:hypothetical protein
VGGSGCAGGSTVVGVVGGLKIFDVSFKIGSSIPAKTDVLAVLELLLAFVSWVEDPFLASARAFNKAIIPS